MRALLSRAAGGPETLTIEEIADPVPGPDELLVRVAAVSLNYPDALIIEDRYQFKPERPFAPGGELAGTVVAIGANVTGIGVGDRICALTAYNALAELAVVERWRTFVIPDEMGFDVASTLLMAYGTNLHGLADRALLKPGETLLVLGAGGGIGLSAVELGKAMCARVIGAVSSSEKSDAVRAAGADDVVIYPSGPLDKVASKALADRFKAACPDGFDVIYDPVGGDYAEPALRAIGWEGRYVVVGFTAGISKIPLNLTLLKACSIVGLYWGRWAARNQPAFHDQMARIFEWWREEKVRPLISRRYPFQAAPAAIALLGGRGAVGKLVVMIEGGTTDGDGQVGDRDKARA